MFFDVVMIPGISGSDGTLKDDFMGPKSLVLMYRLNESEKAVFRF